MIYKRVPGPQVRPRNVKSWCNRSP